MEKVISTNENSVVDQGFPVGGAPTRWGWGPPTLELFGKNVCKNERIGSRLGGREPAAPPGSANGTGHHFEIVLKFKSYLSFSILCYCRKDIYTPLHNRILDFMVRLTP